jgi:hypothetical protein
MILKKGKKKEEKSINVITRGDNNRDGAKSIEI